MQTKPKIHTKERWGEKEGVQTVFFLSTINIGEWSVYSWLYKTKDVGSGGIPKLKSGRDSRNISQTRNKSCPRTAFAETFMKSLPKMESHYCRSTTSKVYLELI